MEDVNWRFYSICHVPRNVVGFAENNRSVTIKKKLIFLSHENEVVRSPISDDCGDREWKISPLNGDGNSSTSLIDTAPLPGMEDKSPEWGRKHFKTEYSFVPVIEWKISPLNGDGNAFCDDGKNFAFCEWKISPLNGDGNTQMRLLLQTQ